MLNWFRNHGNLIYGLGALSLVMFLVSPMVVTFVITRIPANYFALPHRPHAHLSKRPLTVVRFIFLILKNTFGILFIIAGLAMLVLPGQGLLTIVLGISLLNFPGKYRTERWLITRGPTLRLVNRLRHHYNRKPLILSPEHPSSSLNQ